MCSYCWRQLRREALLCCEILSRLSFLPPNPHPMTPNLSPFRHRRVCVHAHAAVTRSHTHPQHVFNALLTCIVWAPNEQSHPPPAFLTSSLTSIPLPLASRACDVLTARSLAEHRLPFCTATLSLSVLVTLPSCRRPFPRYTCWWGEVEAPALNSSTGTEAGRTLEKEEKEEEISSRPVPSKRCTLSAPCTPLNTRQTAWSYFCEGGTTQKEPF